jgi:hypothetical protein
MRDTIAVYSLWRDSEPHLSKTLSQLEDLEDLDYDFEYYFYENDSKDSTVALLESWLEGRSHEFLHEDLDAESFGSVQNIERMQMLCGFRNKCKDLLKNSSSKYTLMIDSDINFDKNNLESHLNLIDSLEDAVLVTPNIRQNIPDYTFEVTSDSYYDVYPLLDRSNSRGLYWTDCPFKNGLDRMNWSLGNPIKCNSAFGGFALSYTDIIKQVKWSTDGECDHVNFCKELSAFGSIYVDPMNKVNVEVDLSKHDLDRFKNIAQQQLNA